MGKGRLALFIAGVAICLYACDDPSLVGVDFVGSDPLSVTYYDTVSIQLSTIKFDSIATSSIDNLLIGKSMDSYLGDITAYSFFQVGRDSLSTYPDDEKAVYDSIALELVFNEYSYYDTTKLQKYYLYSLIDEMELNDDGYLYNTSTYSYGLDSIYYLGEISFYPKVHRGKAEYLRIVDEFGKALFDLLVTKDDIVTINDDFFEYIRGFVLVPDTANTCIIGLDTETNIRLYYTQEGSQIEQAFPIANIRFTRIKSENPVAALGRLANQQDILPSDDTDHVAFIQGGMGLGMRLEFPYLQYVRELSENSMVTDAELILRPVRKSYSGFAPLPSELAAYVVDKRNNILGQIDISTSIYYDDEFQMDTYYLVSITSFLNDQLDLLEDDGSAILFTLPDSDNAGTVNRIYFGDEKSDSRSYMRLLVMNINDTF